MFIIHESTKITNKHIISTKLGSSPSTTSASLNVWMYLNEKITFTSPGNLLFYCSSPNKNAFQYDAYYPLFTIQGVSVPVGGGLCKRDPSPLCTE